MAVISTPRRQRPHPTRWYLALSGAALALVAIAGVVVWQADRGDSGNGTTTATSDTRPVIVHQQPDFIPEPEPALNAPYLQGEAGAGVATPRVSDTIGGVAEQMHDRSPVAAAPAPASAGVPAPDVPSFVP